MAFASIHATTPSMKPAHQPSISHLSECALSIVDSKMAHGWTILILARLAWMELKDCTLGLVHASWSIAQALTFAKVETASQDLLAPKLLAWLIKNAWTDSAKILYLFQTVKLILIAWQNSFAIRDYADSSLVMTLCALTVMIHANLEFASESMIIFAVWSNPPFSGITAPIPWSLKQNAQPHPLQPLLLILFVL